MWPLQRSVSDCAGRHKAKTPAAKQIWTKDQVDLPRISLGPGAPPLHKGCIWTSLSASFHDRSVVLSSLSECSTIQDAFSTSKALSCELNKRINDAWRKISYFQIQRLANTYSLRPFVIFCACLGFIWAVVMGVQNLQNRAQPNGDSTPRLGRRNV